MMNYASNMAWHCFEFQTFLLIEHHSRLCVRYGVCTPYDVADLVYVRSGGRMYQDSGIIIRHHRNR